MRRSLQRAHIWLGWIVGGQLVLWMLSGLVMTAMPIERVRGEHLQREIAAPLGGVRGLVPPEAVLRHAGADSVTLRLLDGRPVYELREGKTPLGLHDARTGHEIVLDAAAIRRIAEARYAGDGTVAAVARVDPANVPLDLRRDDPAWAVRFADGEGTVFYLHALTGDLLAARTNGWRLFDVMWGLHIMDWRMREDMNHPLLVAAAALGLLTTVGGVALLVLRARRPRRAA